MNEIKSFMILIPTGLLLALLVAGFRSAMRKRRLADAQAVPPIVRPMPSRKSKVIKAIGLSSLFLVYLIAANGLQAIFYAGGLFADLRPECQLVRQSFCAMAAAAALLPVFARLLNLFFTRTLTAAEKDYSCKNDLSEFWALPYFLTMSVILSIECLFNLARGTSWTTIKRNFPGLDPVCDWLFIGFRKAFRPVVVYNASLVHALVFCWAVHFTLTAMQISLQPAHLWLQGLHVMRTPLLCTMLYAPFIMMLVGFSDRDSSLFVRDAFNKAKGLA